MIDILLFFVAQGATLVRLDAIAYLWKELGTNCIHLPQTHEVVKLLRDVLEQIAPHVKLITETNVPHQENVSYFGDGDEAHLVYQFSLPPLLLEAILSEDATALQKWLLELEPPPKGCTFFNFTASHDGVGVRPLEGLISEERFERLVANVYEREGLVGMKRDPSGKDSPYELNISYFSAVAPAEPNAEDHIKRFLCTQAIMMSLQGVPGIYFHSLFGTPNDVQAAAQSGIPRRINRRKFEANELEQLLIDSSLPHRAVLDDDAPAPSSCLMCCVRPICRPQVIESDNPKLLVFQRYHAATNKRVTVAANFGAEPVELDLPGTHRDLLSEAVFDNSERLLERFQVAWLVQD